MLCAHSAATCVIGIAAFGEGFSFRKAFWIGLIILGVVGLNLSGDAGSASAAKLISA